MLYLTNYRQMAVVDGTSYILLSPLHVNFYVSIEEVNYLLHHKKLTHDQDWDFIRFARGWEKVYPRQPIPCIRRPFTLPIHAQNIAYHPPLSLPLPKDKHGYVEAPADWEVYLTLDKHHTVIYRDKQGAYFACTTTTCYPLVVTDYNYVLRLDEFEHLIAYQKITKEFIAYGNAWSLIYYGRPIPCVVNGRNLPAMRDTYVAPTRSFPLPQNEKGDYFIPDTWKFIENVTK